MIELNWYKIGYQNYKYYLDRKRICYGGKKITFSRNQRFYQEVLLTFFQVENPRDENTTYLEYLRSNF